MSEVVVRRSSSTNLSSAIGTWRKALSVGAADGGRILADIYRSHWPTQGELIFTGACSFQCAHCIYPPSFAHHNHSLEPEQWNRMLRVMADQLDIGTFVYGGRSVTSNGLEVLRELRRALPAAHIGIIDNGISGAPHADGLRSIRPDWIDISLDGLAADHDRQRGRQGSFADGVRGALGLKERRLAPKINVLTCLTRLNYRSVCPMIREMNALGFKNFFVTPVTLAGGAGPSPDLRLSREQFAWFLGELRATAAGLDDGWVELLLFSADYVVDFLAAAGDCGAAWKDGGSEVVWAMSMNATGRESTPFLVRYFPFSLTGIREMIINTNGDVIVPKAMVHGTVPQDMVLGNLLREEPRDIVLGSPERPAFAFYRNELQTESSVLKGTF